MRSSSDEEDHQPEGVHISSCTWWLVVTEHLWRPPPDAAAQLFRIPAEDPRQAKVQESCLNENFHQHSRVLEIAVHDAGPCAVQVTKNPAHTHHILSLSIVGSAGIATALMSTRSTWAVCGVHAALNQRQPSRCRWHFQPSRCFNSVGESWRDVFPSRVGRTGKTVCR